MVEKPKKSPPRAEESVRVRMRKLGAGPAGVLEPGQSYDLPRAEAEELLRVGAAVRVQVDPAAPAPAGDGFAYPGPWSPEDWTGGLALRQWAAARAPAAWAGQNDNAVFPKYTSPLPGDEEKDRRHKPRIARLREHLRADLAAREIELRFPSADPRRPPDPIPEENLPGILASIDWYGIRPNEVYWGKEWHEVRVFRPALGDRGKTADHKGRPGRKPKWDWPGAVRYLMAEADSLDGLPKIQAEIERLVAEWFLEKYNKEPAESTIREFVRTYCADILKAGN